MPFFDTFFATLSIYKRSTLAKIQGTAGPGPSGFYGSVKENYQVKVTLSENNQLKSIT